MYKKIEEAIHQVTGLINLANVKHYPGLGYHLYLIDYDDSCSYLNLTLASLHSLVSPNAKNVQGLLSKAMADYELIDEFFYNLSNEDFSGKYAAFLFKSYFDL